MFSSTHALMHIHKSQPYQSTDSNTRPYPHMVQQPLAVLRSITDIADSHTTSVPAQISRSTLKTHPKLHNLQTSAQTSRTPKTASKKREEIHGKTELKENTNRDRVQTRVQLACCSMSQKAITNLPCPIATRCKTLQHTASHPALLAHPPLHNLT